MPLKLTGQSLTGANNLASGFQAGFGVTGDDNLAAGDSAGQYITGGSNIASGNSPMLKGLGYSYQDFDAGDGAVALLSAYETHDDTIVSYRRRARARIAELDPRSEASMSAHRLLLRA